VLLGLGEKRRLPRSSKLLAQHLPSDKLGSANGLIGVGIALGPGSMDSGGRASANRVRKVFIISAHALMAISLVAAAIGDVSGSVASLVCAGCVRIYTIGQTLAGPRVAGEWIGIQNCIANLAGIVAPIITGLVVDPNGQYYWAVIIATTVVTTGSLVGAS
jgi:hypothetical protein